MREHWIAGGVCALVVSLVGAAVYDEAGAPFTVHKGMVTSKDYRPPWVENVPTRITTDADGNTHVRPGYTVHHPAVWSMTVMVYSSELPKVLTHTFSTSEGPWDHQVNDAVWVKVICGRLTGWHRITDFGIPPGVQEGES